MLERILNQFGDIMIEISDYIYSLASGLLCGEEEPPENDEKEASNLSHFK